MINSKIDFTNVLNSTKLGLSEKFKKKIKFMKNPYLKKKFDLSKLIENLNINKNLIIKK